MSDARVFTPESVPPDEKSLVNEHVEGGDNVFDESVIDATDSICECGKEKDPSKPTCSVECAYIYFSKGTIETLPLAVCSCKSKKAPGAVSCKECKKAKEWYNKYFVKYEGYDMDYLKEKQTEYCGVGVAGKCFLCHRHYVFGGNNPQPLIDDYFARCCEKCYRRLVLPARYYMHDLVKDIWRMGFYKPSFENKLFYALRESKS